MPGSEKPLVDTVEASWVMERLEQLAPAALLGEEHFFLGWGLHRPHLPFLFPEEFLAHYPEEEVLHQSTVHPRSSHPPTPSPPPASPPPPGATGRS